MKLFGKSGKPGAADENIAMKIIVQGQTIEVSYRDLCLSNMQSLQALVAVLVRKGLVNLEELQEEIKRLAEAAKASSAAPPATKDE